MLKKGKSALLSECVGGSQQYSTGYRKKTGNQCAGGVALNVGKAISCGASASKRGFFGWIWWFIVWIFKISFWVGLAMLSVWLFYRYRHLLPGACCGERSGGIRFVATTNFADCLLTSMVVSLGDMLAVLQRGLVILLKGRPSLHSMWARRR